MPSRIKAFDLIFKQHIKNKPFKRNTVYWPLDTFSKDLLDIVVKNGRMNRGAHVDDDGDVDGATVWSDDKQSKFILKLMEGTAPLTFLMRHTSDDETGEEIYEIYDGANRAEALKKFYSNELCIKVENEYYFFKDLTLREKNMFTKTKAEICYYSNCPESFICAIAAAFNNGTPMSIGELLSFVRVQDTPRAKFFYQVVEDNPWVTHEFGIRSMGIKMVGMIIMHIEEKTNIWKESRLDQVKVFYDENVAVRSETTICGLFSNFTTIIDAWKSSNAGFAPGKELGKFVVVFEAASILGAIHKKSVSNTMINKLLEKTVKIAKYSPAKLVAAMLE